MKIERLRSLRERKGLSQTAAAKKMGIVRTTYSNYEAGNREPDFETLKKMADFFEVTLDYLYGDDSNKMVLDDNIKKRLNEEFDKLTKEEQENLLAFIERMPKKGK